VSAEQAAGRDAPPSLNEGRTAASCPLHRTPGLLGTCGPTEWRGDEHVRASSQRATEARIQQRGLTRASAAARLMSEAMVAHNRNRSISKIQQSHRDSLRHRWVERVLMLFCSADYLIKDQMVNERPVEVFSAVCPRRGTRQRRPFVALRAAYRGRHPCGCALLLSRGLHRDLVLRPQRHGASSLSGPARPGPHDPLRCGAGRMEPAAARGSRP
jgi:hypothetical protein